MKSRKIIIVMIKRRLNKLKDEWSNNNHSHKRAVVNARIEELEWVLEKLK